MIEKKVMERFLNKQICFKTYKDTFWGTVVEVTSTTVRLKLDASEIYVALSSIVTISP